MRKFSKFLCTILTFIMLLGGMGSTVLAVSSITELKATVTEPAVGKKPSDVTVNNSRLQVKETNWEGNFNEDGTFKAGEVYTVIYKINFKNYKDVVNYRIKPAANKSTLNGNLAEITFKDGIENATLKYTFPALTEQGIKVAEKPKISTEDTLDLTKIYSVQEAYNRWAEGNPQHPTELIINDQKISLSGIYPGNGSYEALCLKRVLLDYEVTKFNEADAFAMVYLSNLKEVWLSPKVDVVAFLENLETYPKEAQYPNLKGYMFDSGGALTYDFTLYVSDASLPNGYVDGWSRTSSGWDPVGYANLMFKTKLYSGDVYEAFKKGDSAARDWCKNHIYTAEVTTADRIYKHKSCQNPVMYFYSCKYCGLSEKNPNHTFSKNEYNEYDYSKFAHSYTIKDLSAKNYLGKNSAGDDVYLYSCNWCGINQYEYDTIYYSREDFNADFGANAELTYEYWMSNQKKGWEKDIPEYLEKTTVESDWLSAFAVKGNSSVTANYSGWDENEIKWANANDLLDLSLLGNDYTWGINRQQFCSVAVKLAEKLTGKEIASAPVGTFNDTDNIYVLKAYSAGITSGTGEGAFSPYTTLTREQMATFIHRALMYVKNNSKIRYTPYESQLGSFSDSWSISSWANEPMAFMNALGLIKGKSDTAIDPQGTCTIQEAILVAQRSVNADEIGYYQAVLPDEKNLRGWKGGTNGKNFLPTSDNQWMMIQHSYTNGDRIWVTGPKVGNTLPITDKYNGEQIWAYYEDFKPVRELSEDDIYAYEYYNKNNVDKFKAFVAPAYKGTK